MRAPVAVLLLIYRRPALTEQVLRRLREVRPAVLLVAADAPATEAEQIVCQRTRELVAEGVDWPCVLATRYAPEHLGCKRAVSSALDWAFSQHERVIVVEDDCVPDPTFFRFCEEMLERYADDHRVMQVCGSNLTGRQPGGDSYFFSRFGPVWGWATWRRAWACYDVHMTSWPEHRDSRRLQGQCPEPFEADWRREIFDAVHEGRIDTWDYQWAYAKMILGGLNIVPARHLVANIGFGADATHTRAADDPRGKLATLEMPLPLTHPAEVAAWVEADREYLQKVAGLPASHWSVNGGRHWLKSWVRRLRRRGLS
ncbi:MAG: hypothetical protein U0984_04290 [Prosthecobacter sp.]|nr:hypothetical protein [Prosthecobacter sp.]